MRKLSIVIVLLFCMISSSCKWLVPPDHPKEDGLVVKNLSTDTVCCYIAMGINGFMPTAYPDTLLPQDMIIFNGKLLSEYIDIHAVPPNRSFGITPLFVVKDDGNLGFQLPAGILSVFFISKDTLRKYGYDTVRERNLILDRYDLPMSEVRKNDYIITYAPDSISQTK